MGAIACQITNLTIVYSTIYSDADQRKHQSSASLPFVRETTGDRWILHTNGQLRLNVQSICFLSSQYNGPSNFILIHAVKHY